MSEIKLLKCPFCGGEAYLEIATNDYDILKLWHCRCRICGSASACYISKNKAIEAWNTRKPMENIVERLGNKHNESTINYHNLKDASCLGERHAYRNAIEIVKEEGE